MAINKSIKSAVQTIDKAEILSKLCYTQLVYGRINKKLKTQLSDVEIEKMLYRQIDQTAIKNFMRKGKNIYVLNVESQIRITINSNTNRIITVDSIL